MEDYRKFTNDELLTSIQTISENHEKMKQEMLILHEMLVLMEEQYVALTSELKNRK